MKPLLSLHNQCVVVVFSFPPTAKGIWGLGSGSYRQPLDYKVFNKTRDQVLWGLLPKSVSANIVHSMGIHNFGTQRPCLEVSKMCNHNMFM